MTVRHDDTTPVRFIEVEVEVPGTPEQVWQAIATGPGFSAWFYPTEVEERLGGAVTFHMGPGMDSQEVITGWDPPHRFVAEGDWMPGAPPMALEIVVEAKAGGVCRVRLVNSLFTSKADWDDQLESLEKGWPLFLQILRLYMSHFPGSLCRPACLATVTTKDEQRAWTDLLDGLGLAGATAGERRGTHGLDAPALDGVVESVSHHAVLLRSEAPAPGLVALGVSDCGPHGAMVWVSLYLYGEGAPTVVAREEPKWQAWLGERFPAPAAQAGEPVEATR